MIGLIGGYGLQDMLSETKKYSLKTRFGKPSDNIIMGHIGDKEIFIIPRHGKNHTIPPHKINHKANIIALKDLGVDKIICTASVGILNDDILPGDFVIPVDFIDMTGQIHTFFDSFEQGVFHTDMSNPYSPKIRKAFKEAGTMLNLRVKEGVYVNTKGPRFETIMENSAFRLLGGDIVGMTNVPEIILANEIRMETATIAIGTNYGTGISKHPLTIQEVQLMMKKKNDELNRLISETIKLI